MDRATYEIEAEAFLTELYSEEHAVGAGLKETLELAPIYQRHPGLFSEEAVRARLAESDSAAGRYLADLAVTEYLEGQTATLREEIVNAELAATLPWDGQALPYQEVPVRLMNEDDRLRRAELANLYHARQAELNPSRARRWNRLHLLTRQLGLDDYVATFDRLRALNLRRLSEQVTWLLDVTDHRYEAELAARLEAHGIPRAEAGIWDVALLLRAKELDALFPAERMLPALRGTLAGLGIDLDAQPNVHLDTEPRPLKQPRAFCTDIRTPQDVRLVIKPAGGMEDYASLLHEAGHAEHAAHVDPDLEFAYRRLGDASVSEGYAFLLEHLLLSPAWLEGVMGLKPADHEAVIRSARFALLWYVRRYSAKLNYELELHAGLVDARASAYVHWLGRGCRVRIPPQRYLADVDDGFYVAHYLRAWMFEAQLRDYLERTFGAEWFARPATGDALKELWRQGQQYPVEELARQMGAPGLEVNPLVAQLR